MRVCAPVRGLAGLVSATLASCPAPGHVMVVEMHVAHADGAQVPGYLDFLVAAWFPVE